MLEENLEISTEIVRVRYRFLNEGPTDISATVAFPMPPYRLMDDGCEEQPIRDFSVIVEGKPVAVKLNRKAEISGQDVTDKLRRIGLTDGQIFFQSSGCLRTESNDLSLTKRQFAAIAKLGKERNHYSHWKVVETYYWEQTFPAGREIEVQHEYRPSVGSTFNYLYRDGLLESDVLPTAVGNGANSDPDPKEACVNDALRQVLNKRAKSLGEGRDAIWVLADFNDVEYILGTGRNWKGPIGQFTLRIKKKSPDQVVSLCFPGRPKIIDPMTLEFTQESYTPQDRLVIYFYTISSDYQITPKTLAAVTPPSVFVPYASPANGGAHVIALAKTNSDISEFMHRLKVAGAPNVNILELSKVDACGSHLLRADLQIDGNNSDLRYVPKIPEFSDVSILVRGERISCRVRLATMR